MIHAAKRRLAVLGNACAALAFLASCTTSSLVSQQANPDYVGKSFKSVMVVAVTADEMVRRKFEDRMVAVKGDKLIWSARTRTTNAQASTGAELAPQYMAVILEAMKKDKLL